MSLLKEKIELEIQEAELGIQQQLYRLPALVRWAVIICVLGLIPAYYVAKSASFNYWQAKYEPELISAKPSFTSPLPPKLSDVRIFVTGEQDYSAIVEITNQNVDLTLPETAYDFRFFNSNNELVHTAKDKLFLLPDQKKYVFAPRFISQEKIVSANLVLPETLNWQKRLSIPKVSLSASTPTFSQSLNPLAFVVEGNFVNNSPYNLAKVRLSFLVFNRSNQIIMVSQRDESTLKPFERRAFKQLWPGIYAVDIGGVKVTAETNVLDNTNLLLPSGSLDGASDLSRPEVDPF